MYTDEGLDYSDGNGSSEGSYCKCKSSVSPEDYCICDENDNINCYDSLEKMFNEAITIHDEGIEKESEEPDEECCEVMLGENACKSDGEGCTSDKCNEKENDVIYGSENEEEYEDNGKSFVTAVDRFQSVETPLTTVSSHAKNHDFSLVLSQNKNTTKVNKKSDGVKFKMEASSAINRRKKQYEIDRQNMIILRKLREVKPVVVLPK